jgi:hypothetical protein
MIDLAGVVGCNSRIDWLELWAAADARRIVAGLKMTAVVEPNVRGKRKFHRSRLQSMRTLSGHRRYVEVSD